MNAKFQKSALCDVTKVTNVSPWSRPLQTKREGLQEVANRRLNTLFFSMLVTRAAFKKEGVSSGDHMTLAVLDPCAAHHQAAVEVAHIVVGAKQQASVFVEKKRAAQPLLLRSIPPSVTESLFAH